MKKENKTKGRLTHITTNGGKKDPARSQKPEEALCELLSLEEKRIFSAISAPKSGEHPVLNGIIISRSVGIEDEIAMRLDESRQRIFCPAAIFPL